MRVAILTEHADNARGGAETSTAEMARCLAQLGCEVTIVHAARTGAGSGAETDSNPARIALLVSGVTKLARTRRFLAAADAWLRERRFDIVHSIVPCLSCDVYQPRGGTYAETIAQSVALASNPLVRTVKRIGRRLNRRQQYLLAVERALLGGANPPFVAAVSEYVRRQALRDFPAAPAERIRVVFNGVNAAPLDESAGAAARSARRAELALDEATPLLLFVAHNFKLKGLGALLHALASLRDATRLVVVGRDRPRAWRSLARRLGVASRVHLAGAAGDVYSWYAAADLLVHPTWYDPCSRVVLEALCCGLPVVTTACNGAAEAMRPGVHGVVIDTPRDSGALAAAIAEALNPELRAACRADAGRQREALSMQRHARELLALYSEILGRPTTPPATPSSAATR